MNGELDKVSNGEQSVDETIKAITEYGNRLTRYYQRVETGGGASPFSGGAV